MLESKGLVSHAKITYTLGHILVWFSIIVFFSVCIPGYFGVWEEEYYWEIWRKLREWKYFCKILEILKQNYKKNTFGEVRNLKKKKISITCNFWKKKSKILITRNFWKNTKILITRNFWKKSPKSRLPVTFEKKTHQRMRLILTLVCTPSPCSRSLWIKSSWQDFGVRGLLIVIRNWM